MVHGLKNSLQMLEISELIVLNDSSGSFQKSHRDLPGPQMGPHLSHIRQVMEFSRLSPMVP